jgi:hypothetical protein
VKTTTPAIIVYVREKSAASLLANQEQIPRTITHGKFKIAIDVWPLAGLKYQFGQPPWFCRDRVDNQGTVTTLCRDSSAQIRGLTCAHCIGGKDNDPSTSEPIYLWDAGQNDYLPVGMSGAYVDTTGFGIPGNFGFSDWGLFSVTDPVLENLGRTAAGSLFGATTVGTQVNAVTAHGLIQGVIEHTQIQFPNLYADVAIHITQGATYPGDSGALWKDSLGRAVAIHAIGTGSDGGSPISVAMFAERIASDLKSVGVQMLNV